MPGQLDFQAEAEECPDDDDDAEDDNGAKGRGDGDGPDDVRSHEQLQTEQDYPAKLLPESAVGSGFVTGDSAGDERQHEGNPACDRQDPGGVDRASDSFDCGFKCRDVAFLLRASPCRVAWR